MFVPYTLSHATQFMEFLGGIAKSAGESGNTAISTAHIRPIAADDVALTVASVALSPPADGTVEIAGPERSRTRTCWRAISRTGAIREQ